jgi:hypothetical protein
VRYGTTCGTLTVAAKNGGGGLAQEVDLAGLAPVTQYFFVVDATDPAGNVTTDDNGGSCYQFTTLFQHNYFTYLDPSVNFSDQTLTFTPDGSPDFYSACREPATAFPVDPTGGTPTVSFNMVPWTFQVDVQNGQHVWLYGVPYDRFYVSRYGSVTFDAPDPKRPQNLFASHFSHPRVSAFLQLPNDEARGWVSAKQLADRVVVSFQGMRNDGDREENDAQIELFFDGRIRITIVAVNNTFEPPLVGLSAGGGVPADFVPTDLPSTPACGDLAPPITPLSGRALKVAYWVTGLSFNPKVITFPKYNHSFFVDINDPGLVLPAAGSAADPTINGASLILFNPTIGQRETYAFPAQYWHSTGDGYIYRLAPGDLSGSDILKGDSLLGPCSTVLLEPHRFRTRCKGTQQDGIHFTLTDPNGQGSLATELTLGAGPSAVRYCTAFGGQVLSDTTFRFFGGKAKFYARSAPAPAACPLLP